MEQGAQVIPIETLYARKPKTEQPLQESLAQLVEWDDKTIAIVLERLLDEWLTSQRKHELTNEKAARLATRIMQIYRAHPDTIQYIARNGERLDLLDKLHAPYRHRKGA